MFCPYCGKEFPEGVTFCPECGKSVQFLSDKQSQQPQSEESIPNSAPDTADTSGNDYKKNRILIIAAICVVALCVGFFWLASNTSKDPESQSEDMSTEEIPPSEAVVDSSLENLEWLFELPDNWSSLIKLSDELSYSVPAEWNDPQHMVQTKDKVTVYPCGKNDSRIYYSIEIIRYDAEFTNIQEMLDYEEEKIQKIDPYNNIHQITRLGEKEDDPFHDLIDYAYKDFSGTPRFTYYVYLPWDFKTAIKVSVDFQYYDGMDYQYYIESLGKIVTHASFGINYDKNNPVNIADTSEAAQNEEISDNSEPSETIEDTETQTPPPEEKQEEGNGVDAKEWPTIAELGLDNETMLKIYNDYVASLADSPDDVFEAAEFEEKNSNRIAKKYGLTAEEADMVYSYVLMNYDKVASGGKNQKRSYYKIKFGKFLSAQTTGSTIAIKAKIDSNLTNKMTIEQNYYNVCDLIKNQGLDVYDEVQYWAVADMTSGDEAKVISFTVPKSVIDKIASGNFPDNTLGDYVEDLWIHPSLK